MVLPAKTTSFQRWSERLREYAASEALAAEEDYWLASRHGERRRPLRWTIRTGRTRWLPSEGAGLLE